MSRLPFALRSGFTRRSGLALAALLLAAPGALAQIPQAIVSPDAPLSRNFGVALSGIADVNADGRGDILIGEPRGGESNNDGGKVYVFSGAGGERLRQIDAPVAGGSLFGFSVSAANDPFGNGMFITGAPGEDVDGVVDAGRAYVYTSASNMPSLRLSYPGGTPSAAFGTAVALLPVRSGSTQPRGITAVGAPGHTVGSATNAGIVYLYYATGSFVNVAGFTGSGAPNARFGAAVAAVDDLNGDLGGDVVVGAPGERKVYVYEGRTSARLYVIDAASVGGASEFGQYVAGVPDADGDGRGDILVGDQDATDGQIAGRAFLFSGRTGTLLRTFVSPNPSANAAASGFGTAVAGVPDADGDGRGDLLVGASSETVVDQNGSTRTRAGRAYLFSGATGALIRTLTAPTGSVFTTGFFGAAVAGLFDSNGRGDVAIRAERTPLSLGGTVYHFRNQTRTLALAGQQGWRLLSAPVTTSIGQTLGPTWTQGAAGADESDGDPNVYRYDEAVPGARGLGYTGVTDIATSSPLGAGYAVYVYADDDARTAGVQGGFPKTLRPQGLPYEGPGRDVTFPVSFTASSTVQNDGWNLVGNPYNASLDWDSPFWIKQNVDNTLYVYDPVGGVYRTWNGSAGSLGDGLIAEAQAFWAKANAAGPTLAARFEAASAAPATQAPRAAEPAALGIEIAGTLAGQPVRDAAFVSFVDGASGGLDPYDAYELAPFTGTFVSLHAALGDADGTLLDIDARAPLAGEATFALDAAAFLDGAPAGGAFTLAWPDLSGLPDAWALTLTDTETGAVVDLRAQATYAFTLDTAARAAAPEAADGPPAPTPLRAAGGPARFVVAVRGTAVAGEGAAPGAASMLEAPRPNPASGAVALSFALAEAGPARLAVYDALGRRAAVVAEGAHEAGRHTSPFDASRLPAGLYVVRLEAAGTLAVRTLTVVR